MNTLISKVFNNGNSQAVRIPASLRLDVSEVQIYQNKDGDLVIHPIVPAETQRGDALFAVLRDMDAHWLDELERVRKDALPMQDREAL